MQNFIVASRTPLRPDPDDQSQEIHVLEINDRVAHLHEIGDWSKISFADQSGRTLIGWVHTNVLKEVQSAQIPLFDAPFGQSRIVSGDVIEVRVALPPWRKVRVRLLDGSVVEGWVDDSQLDPGPGQGTTDADPPPEAGHADDLDLGPNEVYRPHLLRAQRITDIDAAALAALIDAEAAKLPDGRWNSQSAASSSSAAGLTQFIAGTWRAHARRRDTLLNKTARDKGYITSANDIEPSRDGDLLKLRFDPELSIVSAAEYGVMNLNALIEEGLVSDQIGDDEKARFIYLAHHEGLGGAQGFLRGTKSYTFSDLVTQVGNSKAQAFVDAAGGDTTKAYRAWLNGYMDSRIRPAKFRKGGAIAPGGAGTAVLSQFAGPAVALAELGAKPDLAKAIQWRLSELGYLDPPADGIFGPVSNWALSEFCDRNGLSLGGGFTRLMAQTLMSPAGRLPDIQSSGGWFDKVIAYMKGKKYFINRHPDCRNIVYLEGVDKDGTLNSDARNVFNDLRIVFTIDRNGRPDFETSIWEGTTEPGEFWTFEPMNPKGAARIAFNQYKAWVVGTHHASSPQAHEALVQTAPITVFRDLNKDFKRPGDEPDTGIFAINQHWGYDAPVGDLGNTSAGCLVGRTKDGHRKFMALIKSDPRYKVNHAYKFVTAVLPGDDVLA
jgi:hypothetical protein